MTDDEKRALREKAERATQEADGEWAYIDGPLMGDIAVDTKPSRPGSPFRLLRVGPGPVGPFIAAASPSTVIALLDENERLRKLNNTLLAVATQDSEEIERLHHHAADLLRDKEQQLSAMTAARDEACDIAQSWAEFRAEHRNDVRTCLVRIDELRKVGT